MFPSECVKVALGADDSLEPLQSIFEHLADADAPLVLADASQVHQVVMNLGTNAAHAMRERGGELSLHVDLAIVDEELSRRRPDLRPGRYAR